MTEAEQERAKVVAWLMQHLNKPTLPFRFVHYAINAIERGEHLKGREG